MEPDDFVIRASLMNSLLLKIFRESKILVMTSYHLVNNLFITDSLLSLNELWYFPDTFADIQEQFLEHQ